MLVAGLMQDTPLGRLVAARTERDPAALRRMTPWQRQVRGEWRRFLAEKAARDPRAAQREQRGLQEALARMFG